MGALLEVQTLRVSYGKIGALWGVDLEVREGEILAVVGPNGAGKSSLLHAITGLVAATGVIRYRDRSLVGLPTHEIVALGLCLVPEGRRLFPDLSVRENLLLGSYGAAARPRRREGLDRVLALFPALAARLRQKAHTLSGGEAQMLAIARGLMGAPQLLMLDEPSLGLAPVVIGHLFEAIARIRDEGVTVLLVEQNVHQALEIADRALVLETGRLVLEGEAKALRDSDHVRRHYLAEQGERSEP